MIKASNNNSLYGRLPQLMEKLLILPWSNITIFMFLHLRENIHIEGISVVGDIKFNDFKK